MIPTAVKFAQDRAEEKGISDDFWYETMTEFAQKHVEAALEAAASKARIMDDPNSYTGNTGSEYPPDQIVDKKSILKSYPLKNIQ